MNDLHLAEIPYEGGGLRYRYARRMAPDGTRWIRHGLFQAFHPNGILASEGLYREGVEDGIWRDFHTSGQLAAKGTYRAGKKAEGWRYWSSDGQEESGGAG